MPQTQTPTDDVAEFLAQYRSAQRPPSDDEDDVSSFLKDYRSSQQTDAAAADGAPAQQSTIPIVPFRPPITTQPLDVRAAKVDQPLIPMRPPMFDTSQVPLNVFTNQVQKPGMATVEEVERGGSLEPAPQTITGRIARAVGAGAPQGSVAANLTGQRGTKDNVRLFAPEELMSESEQQNHPVLAGAGDFLGGMTSPENLALIGLTAGAGELAGPGSAAAKRLLAAGFSLPTMISAARMTPAISEAFRNGQTATGERLLTQALLTGGAGALAAHGIFAGEKPAGMVGPREEPLTPETDATLKAQVDALARGSNPVVYFPAGHETLPAPPENAQVTVVPGDQAGAGVYYHDQTVTPDQIHQSVADGTFGQLLGNHQTKHEAILGGNAAAVVARGADGGEVKASLVDGGNPQAIAKQAATLARQFPDAEIGLEHPDDVVSGRQGPGANQKSNAAPPSASRETPGTDEADEIEQFLKDYRATNGQGNARVGVETPEQVVEGRGRVSRLGTTTETRPDGTRVTTEAPSVSKTIFEIENQLVKSGKLSREDIPALRRQFTEGSDRYQAGTDYATFLQRATAEDANSTPAPAPQAASRETPQAGEGDANDVEEFLQQHRDASAIVQPQADELRGLAQQVRSVDPHLSDALSGIADVRYNSPQDLLKIAGRIKDAEAAKNLKSIVDQFNAKSGARTEGSRTPVGESGAEAPTSTADERTFARNAVPENAERFRSSTEDVRSLPREGGNQLGPNVGDTVEVHAGALKGSKLEVTKIGQTGVYAKGESGPIKFVKNGDFAVSRELTSGRTFFANPIGTALSEGSRLLSRAWEQKVARPLIDRVLKIGDKYQEIREADPAIAESLHLLDNAPTYLREKAAQHVQDIVGNLSRPQERLFSLMADSDSRENLKTNHPSEYQQAKNDPAIQQAVRRYKPVEQQLTAARERLGGQTLDQDYLRRVYDHIAGVNRREAGGSSGESTPSDFDRVIRPQKVNTKSRQASAEYHYQNGLHEFGPAFGTKFVATHLKLLRDEVANDFMGKATQVPHGSPEPASITYEGQRYYRPDLAREAQESGRKDVKEYGVYNPSEGERFPVAAEAKFIGPKSVVDTLRDYGGKDSSAPGAVRLWLQQQVLGFGFGVPHVFNILRRVSQTTAGGATNPAAWVRALKVGLSKELRERGMSGLDDPTFDMLAQHGAISTREVSNLKAYIGGNLNPANWMRGIAQVGHKVLFDPKSFGGFGGLDQRARLYVADLMRSQRPDLTDAEIARGVGDALGEYNRANWTERQKSLSRFALFPGWDASSLRWVLQHPIKTTVPPAILTLLANRALHSIGQNHGEDQNDISAVHIGDRAYSTSLLRESMARNLFRPAINFAQAKIQGKNNTAALDEAGRGATQGAGGLLNTLRPDLSGFVGLATNRENIASGKEIVSKADYDMPGKILPSRALEKQAAFAVRKAFPAFDRMLDQKGEVDLRSFVGGNFGVPNYRQSAEDRLTRNAAEAQRVMATVNKLSKSDPAAARAFLKDPDNAALALFHNDIDSLHANVKRIDKAKAQVEDSNLSSSVKAHRLQALERARQNVLSHADGLDQRLFDKRAAGKRSSGPVPFGPPGMY